MAWKHLYIDKCFKSDNSPHFQTYGLNYSNAIKELVRARAISISADCQL